MAFVRGSNPIWFEVDLTSNHFDDTFYLFVLQNDIPYLPATVWHDASGSIPWDYPIQFLANGTLPVDIFFDSGTTYRLEFRQGDTQSAPLIYLVENYMPGSGGVTPPDSFELTTDNQITNPQFSIVNFNSPFEITSGSTQNIDVAPGWVLELTGTGNVTLNKVPLNDDPATINPTNAPYALRITLSGSWTNPVLRQRFQQNGMLWANRTVSSSITARIEGAPQPLTATLVDSNATLLGTVLQELAVSSTFTEYTGHALLPATTNPDLPPAAYIEYRLALPDDVDIYVTSFQLVSGDIEDFEPGFQESTIDRQIDQTFHNYKNSILLQPKDSILVGWNFGLNPWQSRTTTLSNVASFGYTADQAIVIQQAYVASATGNNVSVGRASFTQNYGFQVQAVTATNQFALIQYIDAASVRPYWNNVLSSLVNLFVQKQNPNADLKIKMRLIYRASLPSAVSQTEPIVTWTALGEPVYSAGWTAITPRNDPVYNLTAGDNVLTFENFQLPASSNAAMTLGIVIYTLNPMIQSGTPDYIIFDSLSLVPNEFAIDTNPLTFDETLRQCQYYYETSYAPGVVPGTAVTASSFLATQGASGLDMYGKSFCIPLKTTKRAAVTTTNISFYSPVTGTIGKVRGVMWNSTTQGFDADLSILSSDVSRFWTLLTSGVNNVTYEVTSSGSIGTASGVAATAPDSFIYFHYTLNARLGV